MGSCAVAWCHSYHRKTKNKGIFYHRFPRDPGLCKIWISCCKRAEKFITENARICSLHFSADDYERDLKAELLGLTPKRILKPNAIPHVNLSPGIVSSQDSSPNKTLSNSTTKDSSANETLSNSTTKESSANETLSNSTTKDSSANKTLSNSSTKDSSANDTLSNSTTKDSSANERLSNSTRNSSRENRAIKREIRKRALNRIKLLPSKKSPEMVDREVQCSMKDTDIFRKRMEFLEKDNKSLNILLLQMKQEKKKMHDELIAVRMKARSLLRGNKKSMQNQVKAEVKNLLGKIFSDNQIRCLRSNKKFVKWSDVDLSKANKLRRISKPCYIFLRKEMKFPFPGISTLKRWVAQNKKKVFETIECEVVTE